MNSRNQRIGNSITTALLFWFAVFGCHTSGSDYLHFRRLSPENGLPGEQVNTIFQDSRGFIWIGTSDGLVRFDSHDFRVFRPNPADPYSLLNGYVSDIKEDRDGNLWIATLAGLAKWNRKTDQFSHYQQASTNSNSLSSNQIRCLLIDQDGSIWIGTSNAGLNHFYPGTGKWIRYRAILSQKNSLNDDSIHCLVRDHNGWIWIGTANGGLNYYNPQTGIFGVFTHDPKEANSLNHNHVSAIAEDTRRYLWIGTDNGLCRLDPDRKIIKRFFSDSTGPETLKLHIIDSIMVDRENNVWVGTDGSGLCKYNLDTEKFIQYRHSKFVQHTLGSDVVRTLFQDRSGDYWVGHFPYGISHVNRSASVFQQFCNIPGETNCLSDDHVMSFLEDQSGGLWIGTDNGGLNYYDAISRKWTQYKHDTNNPQSLGAKAALTLLQDQNGQIWVGTWGGGLSCLDPKTGTFQRYKPVPNSANSLGHPHIWRLLGDANNHIWIATSGGGLDCYNTIEKTFAHYRHDPNNPRSLNSDKVSCLLMTRNGTLWVGTTDGLARWAPATRDWDCFRHQSETPDSLSNNDVIDMIEDRKGFIWITTGGGGLNRLNPSTGKFNCLRTIDGLPSNVLRGIIEDNDGILWISSNQGLARLDSDSYKIVIYEENDGLPGREFTPNGRLKLRSGELVWGTTRGFVKFDPKAIQVNTNFPAVVLTSFEVWNQRIQPGLTNSPLQESITEIRRLAIPAKFSVFSFQFAALNYRSSDQNQYLYMMEGFDETWRKPGPERRATFTNLDPGSYCLRVKASNGDNIWNEEGLSVELVIIPPWWRTWWFQVAVTLTLLGSAAASGWFITARRYRARLQEAEREREITREREHTNKKLRELNRALQTLSECNQALVRAKDEATLLNDLCRVLILHGGYRLAWIGFAEQDEAKTVRPVAQAGFEDGYLANLHITWDNNERGYGPTGTAIRTGRPEVVRNILTDPNYAPWRDEAIKRGYASSVALPLKFDGSVLGVLNIYSTKPDAFDEDELRLLNELAGDLAYGIFALRTKSAKQSVEEQLRDIIEFLPDATFVIDKSKRVIAWNLACENLTGFKKQEMLGRGDFAYAEPFYGARRPILIDLLDLPGHEIESSYQFVERKGNTIFAEVFIPRLNAGKGSYLWGAATLLFDREGNRCGAIEVIRDVTEQKCLEKALRESHAILEKAQEVAHLGSWSSNLSGESMLVWSNEIFRIFGLSKEQFDGKVTTFYKRVHPEDRNQVQNASRKAVEQGVDYEIEHRIIRPDGTLRWVYEKAEVIRNTSGEPVQLVGIVQDITERKQAEEKLRRSEEQFRLIMENLADLVAVLDLDGKRIYNSPSYQGILGNVEKLHGSNSFDQIHPEDRARIHRVFEETVLSGVGQRTEYRMIDQNGKIRYIESQGSVIRDSHDKVVQVLVVSRDVTQRKLAEQKIEESEKKYRELVEHANSIILRWSPEGQILFLNEFGQRFFGYSEAEIVGKHVIGTIVPNTESDGRNLSILMEQICSNPAAFQQNTNENMRRNGDRVWIAWTNKVISDSQGRIAEILSIGLDITARKKIEEELRLTQANLEHRVAERTAELAIAKERAEAADKLKSAFLATMSHELRTPLNSIIGFTGILLQGLAGPLNAEQRQQLEMVRSSGQHLLELINDVLDISKIEAGQLVVARIPFDLRASIEKVSKLLRPMVVKKGLEFRVHITNEIGWIVGDQRRVEQILINLLNNAIKFTDHGQVILKCTRNDTVNKKAGGTSLSLEDSTQFKDIVFSIHDTGMGIKPEDLVTLFQPFRQIDSGLARMHEGTGLGLAICRRLAELMDGEIYAESVWGKGSTFTFRLPEGNM